MTVACAARQTPAPMEYLLRKAGLSQEKSMLSSDIRNFMSQRTMRISDPASPTVDSALYSLLSVLLPQTLDLLRVHAGPKQAAIHAHCRSILGKHAWL